MSHVTGPDLLVLHALRTLGYADIPAIVTRLGLSQDDVSEQLLEHDVSEQLLDAQASGRVTWSSFGGSGGWSLTEAGKAYGEIRLAAELDATGARAAVEQAHSDFLPLNELVAQACSNWQLAEMGIGDDPVSLEETVGTLEQAAEALTTIEAHLTQHLQRFGGYHDRFTAALQRADADPSWITGTDRDSCHRVWFELHEDLIATLGLHR